MFTIFQNILSMDVWQCLKYASVKKDHAVKKEKPLISFQEICKINTKENAESLKVIALTERNSWIKLTWFSRPRWNRLKPWRDDKSNTQNLHHLHLSCNYSCHCKYSHYVFWLWKRYCKFLKILLKWNKNKTKPTSLMFTCLENS